MPKPQSLQALSPWTLNPQSEREGALVLARKCQAFSQWCSRTRGGPAEVFRLGAWHAGREGGNSEERTVLLLLLLFRCLSC